MSDQFTPIPTKGLKTNNAGAPTDDNFGVLPAVANAAAPTLTEGDQALLSTDLAGNLRTTFGGIVRVSKDTSANSATDPIFVELTDGTQALDVASGTVSAHTLRVTPATDVIHRVSKDGSANAVGDPIWVELSDGTTALGTPSNPVSVTTGSSTAAKDSGQLTSSALAAGASANLTGAALTANKTGKLIECTFTSSVRIKVELQTVSSGVSPTITTVRTFFREASDSGSYAPADANLITVASAASNMGKFQLKITNEDNHLAADIYGSLSWDEV